MLLAGRSIVVKILPHAGTRIPLKLKLAYELGIQCEFRVHRETGC